MLDRPAELPALVARLSDADASALVDHLKSEADRHWLINANHSLQLADLLVQVGQLRGNTWQAALGTMARGDALKLLGHTEAAWDTLDRAGELFWACGDQVGWARTRIGRVGICVDLNRVAVALDEARQARAILAEHAAHDKCLILDLNIAVVHNLLGEQHQALAIYQRALETAALLGEAGQRWLGPLYTNLGNVYHVLGQLRQAASYHERARACFAARQEPSALAIAELNLAYIAIAQGRYRSALKALHEAYALKIALRIPLDAAHVQRHMVECYLALNRYHEASELAQAVSAHFREHGAAYEEAIALLQLAAAEAELARYDTALAALDRAEPIFATTGAAAWIATTRLQRGKVALRGGDHMASQREARAATEHFFQNGQQVEHAAALVLLGQTELALGQLDRVEPHARAALATARDCNVPALRYAAHLLLGRAGEACGQPVRAARHYRAAAATIDRVQRQLTITLRPGFLEDKGEALSALIGLHLRAGAAERAFEALERAKSQALLYHLANREQLRWANGAAHSQALIDELDQLREEHQWFYRLANDPFARAQDLPGMLSAEQARDELAIRERRMRTIAEQLYINSGEGHANPALARPALRDIQQMLDADTLLIEYYADGGQLWAFTVGASTIALHRLPMPTAEVERLQIQLKLNIDAALKAGPDAPVTRQLTALAKRLLGRLYSALLQPIESQIGRHRRLTIVPFGKLHYLPFHLLHAGVEYLVERYEVVTLPSASMATRPSPRRRPGAVVLAHSWDGRLAQAHVEAQAVRQLFDGQIYAENAARRAALQAAPSQILHIAAHGEHRLDQPDLSYIELADGQLYADDLMQHDLSYELVTLSACATGRAHVTSNDEPIGLSRGVLYAGAGALIVSLWNVSDAGTLGVMERLYQALAAGASKAAALRDAQIDVVRSAPDLHPAFWGAFQLIGNPNPLSAREPQHAAASEKELCYVDLSAAA